jgi:ATP-binding cassette, sub-family E, member 1
LKYFRGSELQGYFKKILENDLKAIIKPQYVDHIPKVSKGKVGDYIEGKDEKNISKELLKDLQLEHLLERDIDLLSGGELQRFAICIVTIRKNDVFMFDEPSSYLDVKQRLKAAQVIRSLIDDNVYVIVVEHDLSILDYLSDYICVLYGKPGVYGVITMPYGVREGINVFLDGYIPTENMRFRDVSLTFKVSEKEEESSEENTKSRMRFRYPKLTKTFGNQFKLSIEGGLFNDSEIVVLLGENGTGKTTTIQLLSNKLQPDENDKSVPDMSISFKPQQISPKFKGKLKNLI